MWLEELVQEQYYTGTRRYNSVRVEGGQHQGETICKCWSAYQGFLRICQFVWARVLCGTRTYHCASVDPSGVLQKIHMREIELLQGFLRIINWKNFNV